jgi:hypothetical protein
MEPEEEEASAEQYRQRAAKTREVAKSLGMRDAQYAAHLAQVAREYDEMADRFEAKSSGKPKTE